MGRVEIDWVELFGDFSPHREEAIYVGAARRSDKGRARWPKRARAGAEGVARASSDDEQPRGTQALHLSPVTRAAPAPAPKAAADVGLDACSAAEKVLNFNQEDVPVLVGRNKKNHEQADGDCKFKRVAHPAMKNDDKEPAPPEEIFEVLREIPSLDRADLLRAYSMLIRDDRLFRSLMGLPKDMRKDWLLMEIGNQ